MTWQGLFRPDRYAGSAKFHYKLCDKTLMGVEDTWPPDNGDRNQAVSAMLTQDFLQLSWDDMRIVHAVKLQGSYTRAARVVMMSETTIGRRISRLEQQLGFALFEAVDGLRRPTSACLDIVENLQAMQGAMNGIVQRLRSPEPEQRKLRLTTINFLAETFLAPALPQFLGAHPRLSLTIDVSDEVTDMSRWEVDFALRLGRPELGNFFMRRVGDLGFCFVRPRRPLQAVPLVCYPEKLKHTPEMQALFARPDLPDTRLETSDIALMARILVGGHGVGIVPRQMMAAHMANPLLEITPVEARREVWLLSQPHMKHDPMGRALSSWCAGIFHQSPGENAPG